MFSLVELAHTTSWVYGPSGGGFFDYNFHLLNGLFCSIFPFLLLPMLTFYIFLETFVGFQICDPTMKSHGGKERMQCCPLAVPCGWYLAISSRLLFPHGRPSHRPVCLLVASPSFQHPHPSFFDGPSRMGSGRRWLVLAGES